MGCKEAVSPKLLIGNGTINCLTFEENTRQPYDNNLCLLRALALFLHRNQRLEEETSEKFNSFMSRRYELSANDFQGVHMNDIPIAEDLPLLITLLYDVDIVEGNILRELLWRSVQKHENTVRLLRYSNHVCYVSIINAVFQYFRCPDSDIFFNR